MSKRTPVKRSLARILGILRQRPLRESWYEISLTQGAYKTVASINLLANSAYLVLATGRNGLTTATGNNVNFTCPGAPVTVFAPGFQNGGAGNPAFSWAYVETGSAQRTLNLQAYGYSSGQKSNGVAIAIKLGGVANVSQMLSRLAEGRWQHEETAHIETAGEDHEEALTNGNVRNRGSHQQRTAHNKCIRENRDVLYGFKERVLSDRYCWSPPCLDQRRDSTAERLQLLHFITKQWKRYDILCSTQSWNRKCNVEDAVLCALDEALTRSATPERGWAA